MLQDMKSIFVNWKKSWNQHKNAAASSKAQQ